MADPQPGQNPIDVKKVIEQSASKTTLQELAKKGIYRVKVLDEAAITRMIGEAVSRIVATKTNLMSDADRQKLVEASRKELDKLVKEFQESKDRNELMEKDKAALATQIESLQEALKLQRKYTDEIAKSRYEEGKAMMQQQVDDLKAQLADARKSGGDEARRAQQQVTDEIKRQALDREQQIRDEYERRLRDSESRVSQQKDAEFGKKLLEEMQRESAKREELQQKNMELNQKLATTMEEMKKSDEELFKKLMELFNKAIEGVNKKLTDLRLRSIAGGVSGGASMPGDVEFRPSQATIEGLLGSELESNMKKMDVEGKTSGKISSALERLKAMRGGGAKPEEKKDEPK